MTRPAGPLTDHTDELSQHVAAFPEGGYPACGLEFVVLRALASHMDGNGMHLRRSARESADITIRLGFVLDVAGYGLRSVPDRSDVQRRLCALVDEVLLDVGIDPDQTERDGTGDGMLVLLPEWAPFQRVLAPLLRTTACRLAADNRRHVDRLQLRMATSIGPVGHGATGYTEGTVTEMFRLVDSEPIRQALEGKPDVDLAVIVSNILFGWVVGAGHPGLEADEFRPVDVRVKSFEAGAWLWTVSERPGQRRIRRAGPRVPR